MRHDDRISRKSFPRQSPLPVETDLFLLPPKTVLVFFFFFFFLDLSDFSIADAALESEDLVGIFVCLRDRAGNPVILTRRLSNSECAVSFMSCHRTERSP